MERDPRSEYLRRLDARRIEAARHQRRHIAIGNIRLALGLAAAIIVWLAFWRGVLSPWWLAAPGMLFLALLFLHERVLQARTRTERAAVFYARGLERLEGGWPGKGESGHRFLDKSHPYSDDLDIFGKGSLFELLSTARTRAGEDTLARWLLAPAMPEEVRSRQAAVSELRSKLDLREDLALLGEDFRSGVNPQQLAAWGVGNPVFDSRRQRALAAILPVLVLAGAIVWVMTGIPGPLAVTLVFEAAFGLAVRDRVLRVIHQVEQPAHDLALLAQVLRRLEQESFESPLLAALRAALQDGHGPPCRRIARLNRLIELLDSRDNFFVRLFGPPALWSTQLSFAVEHWRKVNGPEVGGWLAAVGEMEALSALAGYAYEHPQDPFPGFDDGPAHFAAEGLAHPLLAEARAVPNDVRFGADRPLLVVSGSNMSGKSTLLRTIGVNAVLAMAGAPVRARKLNLSPVAVGASIRLFDSLASGSSRFYMEITRLRQFVDITKGPVPLLFLLDELLHDTNSEDRRIGGEAIVRGLLARGAIGLVTTHDLALARMTDEAGNVHLEDHLEAGKMSFDYLLRPGITRKSNALELMRSVGLEV